MNDTRTEPTPYITIGKYPNFRRDQSAQQKASRNYQAPV